MLPLPDFSHSPVPPPFYRLLPSIVGTVSQMMMVGVVTQWNSVTTLVGLCTFLVHTRLLGRTLTASQGFTSLSLFGILRFPLLVLPDVVNFYLQVKFMKWMKPLCFAVGLLVYSVGGCWCTSMWLSVYQ